MSTYLLDTDTVSLLCDGHPVARANLTVHSLHHRVAVGVICVEELLNGWYALLRRRQTRDQLAAVYQRIADVVRDLSQFPILSFTTAAMTRCDKLIALKLNVGRMDLRIASIALEAGAVVVTRNRRDFGRVPGLTVADWSV